MESGGCGTQWSRSGTAPHCPSRTASGIRAMGLDLAPALISALQVVSFESFTLKKMTIKHENENENNAKPENLMNSWEWAKNKTWINREFRDQAAAHVNLHGLQLIRRSIKRFQQPNDSWMAPESRLNPEIQFLCSFPYKVPIKQWANSPGLGHEKRLMEN